MGAEKFYARGVTYGTFAPNARGEPFPEPAAVEADFALMSEAGINAVRTYTVPPRWLLDLAHRHDLRVLVGLPWEQHLAFLDDRRRCRSIEAQVRGGVRSCAGHPAVLGYAVGNEIPSSIVRWHGARPVERFLERLAGVAREADPGGLVTYANYPTTEYLQLDFVDFYSFNVYLESPEQWHAYLPRLQNVAGDRPLVIAEFGLDSRRNGGDRQASTLDWQIRAALGAGCAGLFAFSWTDEWHRGGHEIEDWDFGLTDRARRPKPALFTVAERYSSSWTPAERSWPRISVVVCTYNGQRTIGECLGGLSRLEYPDYEVIVVDDGSTDSTPEIVARHPQVRSVRTPNRGLSSARNSGLEAATGQIVAYIDDDAYPDPHWLVYLAEIFMTSDVAACGGPNLPPPGDGAVADCVANSPGGPTHVLITDSEAEHIPGCNCAFRRHRLREIGGFDPRFRSAGDDVDVCWRLQQRGWKIGFHAGAVVWHHRRNTVRGYWRQQFGYGKAEAMLERKWPEKYNALGHLRWAGRVYGQGVLEPARRWRVYHGTWGTAPFQRLYGAAPKTLASLPLMPEWYLFNLLLALLVGLGALWSPLLYLSILLACSAAAPFVYIIAGVRGACYASQPRSLVGRLKYHTLTAWLHVAQPVARLLGRVTEGLTPWRWKGPPEFDVAQRGVVRLWSGIWHAPEAWLRSLEEQLRAGGCVSHRSGPFDSWDIEVPGGVLGAVRTRLGVEEHGAGRQTLLFAIWPVWSRLGAAVAGVLALLAGDALLDGQKVAGATLGVLAMLIAGRSIRECARAKAAVLHGLKQLKASETR